MIQLETKHHPAAWMRASNLDVKQWTVPFTTGECEQIVAVARALAAERRPTDDIEQQMFAGASGTLHQTLLRAADDVLSGRGFVLFRGFPLAALTHTEAAYGYAAVGRYFGRLVAQNPQGDVIGKVMDYAKDWKADSTVRGYQTSMHMDFHSDSCDCVGLLCINPAKSGGLSAIVSSVAIYNHMRAHSPELLQVLCEPFSYDRRGEERAGVLPYYETALFHEHDGQMFNRYCREYIESAQRFAAVPRLTPQQVAAMDEFDRLCHSDEFIVHMDFRRGDIQFLNNHVVLHSRTAFQDHAEPERRRLLWRLYLNHRSDAQRPACYASRFSDPQRWALGALGEQGARQPAATSP